MKKAFIPVAVVATIVIAILSFTPVWQKVSAATLHGGIDSSRIDPEAYQAALQDLNSIPDQEYKTFLRGQAAAFTQAKLDAKTRAAKLAEEMKMPGKELLQVKLADIAIGKQLPISAITLEPIGVATIDQTPLGESLLGNMAWVPTMVTLDGNPLSVAVAIGDNLNIGDQVRVYKVDGTDSFYSVREQQLVAQN